MVPDADVLFAGDLIESAGPPSFGPDSVPDEWPATLDAVIGLMTAATLAVPGHGEPVGREFVFEQRGRIAAQAAEKSATAAGAPAGLSPTLVSGSSHEAGLVGDHHQLRPIAGAKFDHRPADMGARRCSADHQALGDLVIAQPFADQRQHLALAIGQRLQLRMLLADR